MLSPAPRIPKTPSAPQSPCLGPIAVAALAEMKEGQDTPRQPPAISTPFANGAFGVNLILLKMPSCAALYFGVFV